MKLSTLAKLAHRHGAIAKNELVPDHISRAGWYRAHDLGLLTPIHPGVSRQSARVPTPHLAVESALLATLPGSSAAGLSSAWLWGAASAASHAVELLAPEGRHPGRLDGVTIHRPTDDAYPRLVPVDGLQACDALRATLDVAAWHPDRLPTVMAELVIAGRYSIKAVRATLAANRRFGRPGIGALAAAIDDWNLGDRPPDSLLEATMADLLARHHLPPAAFQRPISRFRPDFTFVEEIALLECDGWGNHGRTRAQFDADRDRDAELGALGWVVWRYSWTQIKQREAWVARTLRQRLEARRAQLGLPPLAASRD